MVKVGVLALQGAVSEHMYAIEKCGAEAISVKRVSDLERIDGLILPGGESTSMRRLINRYDMLKPLQAFAAAGKPMFGTCAGLILLAKNLVGYNDSHIGILDVTVERNSFGRQVDSFEKNIAIRDIASDFPAVFIRAPHIVEVSEQVEVLAYVEDRIVMARQGNLLGCSFHPELTDDLRITDYFVGMIKESLAKPLNV